MIVRPRDEDGIGGGDRGNVLIGYLFGAALMIVAAVVELRLGVKAEGKSLEDVAPPLSSTYSSSMP